MARFALYSNGKKLETLEDLKGNFTIKDMENNFRTRSLHRWLAEKGLRDELQKIENIPSDGDNSELLMECFALSDEQKAAVRLHADEEKKRIQEEKEPQNPQSVIGLGLPQEEFGFHDSFLGSWRVQVGDAVKEGDVLCEAQTGMRSFNFLSPFDGTVFEILVNQGEKVTDSTPIIKLSANIDQIDIRMPDIFGGIITVDTRHLSLWHVKVGDVVNVGDILCEVQDGPRRSFNVRSQFTGVVSEILAPIGIDVGDISTPPVLLRLRTSNKSPASASCDRRVDVFLTRGNDENIIFILKELRFASDCDLKKAKDTYDSIPSVVVQNTSLDAAEIIKRRIERLGGGVTLKKSQDTTHSDIGHDVILQNYPVENKIAVIKELRSFISCEDLKKAKELAESVPNATIAAGVSIEAAKIMKRILEGSGIDGIVVINESEHSNQAKLVGGFSSSSPFVQNKEKQNLLAGSNIKTIDRVAAVVKQIIGNQLAINPLEIKDSDDIIADLGADEEDIREMQWSISQEFDVNFDYFTNVGQIIACVKRR